MGIFQKMRIKNLRGSVWSDLKKLDSFTFEMSKNDLIRNFLRKERLRVNTMRRHCSKIEQIFYLEISDKWSDWSEYSSCSVTCGPGTSTRTRSCVGNRKRRDVNRSRVKRFFWPLPGLGNQNKPACEGKSEESLECQLKECAGKNFPAC